MLEHALSSLVGDLGSSQRPQPTSRGCEFLPCPGLGSFFRPEVVPSLAVVHFSPVFMSGHALPGPGDPGGQSGHLSVRERNTRDQHSWATV